MSEEKKGHVKLTVEVEINEPLLDVMKELVTKMPSIVPEMMRRQKEERGTGLQKPE